MLSYNLQNAQKVYLGNTEVSNIFLGNTEIFSSIQVDPYSDYVSLLLHMEGLQGSKTFIDSSSNNFPVLTAVDFPPEAAALSNTTLNTSIKKFGNSSAFFDGDGDHILVAVNDQFKFSGDFTIEMWLYPLSFNSRMTLFDNLTFITGTGISFWLTEISGLYRIITANADIGTSTSGPTLNQWNHVALVRNNGVIKIFNNGVEVLSVINTTNFNSGGCVIGATLPPNLNEILYSFNGYIDDYRITNGIARYTSNFTPPTQQLPDPSDPYSNNVSLLMHMDGTNGSQTFTDSSTNNFTLTAYGNSQINTTVKKFGSGSASFDGSGDYIEGPMNTAFDFGNGNFTVEGWFRTTVGGTIVARWSQDGANKAFFVGGDATNIAFYVNDIFITQGPYVSNQWNHFAAVRNGTNLLLFINGVQVGSTYNITTPIQSSNVPIRIGRDHFGNPFFNGNIDELRITKGVARYTSNFIPPTAPFANPPIPLALLLESLFDNLIAYWSFDASNIQDDKLNYNTAVIDGGTPLFESGKYNIGLTLPLGRRLRVSQNLWNMITSPTSFSVAMWVKKNSVSTSPQEAVIAGSIFGPMAFHFAFSDQNGQNADQRLSYAQTTGSSQYRYISINHTMVLGQWIHLVGTYDLSTQTMKFYLNGNLVGTQINVTPPTSTLHPDWTGFCLNGSPIRSDSSEYGDDQSFDMVGFWTKALTDLEVSTLYTNYAEANNFIV